MSKLSEMIATLCPNGVEYKRFSEVCFYIRGVTYGKSQEIRNGEDGWKVLRANNITLSTNSLNYDDVKVISKNVKVKPAQLLRKGDILICAGSGSKEHVGKVAYISEDSDYTFGGFMAVVRAQNADVDTRYLYHVLTRALFINYLKIALNSTTINNLSNSVIGPFEFPLPPLPIQREIVQILDNFANLTAELAKRKKQYEHYRDMLLNFTGGGINDKFGNESGSPHIEWRRLGEVAEIGTGSSNTDEQLEKGVYPFFVRSQEVRWKNEFEYDETAIITSGDGVGVGKIFHFYEGKYALHQRAYRIHIVSDEFLPKYVFYYMKNGFLKYIERNAFQSSVTSIRRPMLLNFQLPLISIAEQKRIVDILDRFDSLCNSLTEGLPAEIALRKKQYEYYRDKLLSFKEAS